LSSLKPSPPPSETTAGSELRVPAETSAEEEESNETSAEEEEESTHADLQEKFGPEQHGIVAALSPSSLAIATSCLAVASAASVAAWGCRQVSRAGMCRRIAQTTRVSRELRSVSVSRSRIFSRAEPVYEYAPVFLDEAPEDREQELGHGLLEARALLEDTLE